MNKLTSVQYSQIAELTKKIEELEGQVDGILGGSGVTVATGGIEAGMSGGAASAPILTDGSTGQPANMPRKRTISPSGRKKIAAAQRARWAKEKAAKAAATPAHK